MILLEDTKGEAFIPGYFAEIELFVPPALTLDEEHTFLKETLDSVFTKLPEGRESLITSSGYRVTRYGDVVHSYLLDTEKTCLRFDTRISTDAYNVNPRTGEYTSNGLPHVHEVSVFILHTDGSQMYTEKIWLALSKKRPNSFHELFIIMLDNLPIVWEKGEN